MSIRFGLNYQIIIEEAARLADSIGLENVTLTAVANSLGVRKPSLYNHVQGLPEIQLGLTIWGTQQLSLQISEAAIGKAKEEAIIAIALAYRNFAHTRPGLYRAIVATPDRSSQERSQASTRLMAVLSKVLAPYNLLENEATHAVRGLRSIMHGFVTLEAAGWFAAPADRDESYLQLVHTFIRGLETRGD